jgi:hypothetical protein
MDVRLSSEQEALRASVAHVVDRLGPRVVAALEDQGRIEKLGEAVSASGWLELRSRHGDGPLASGIEVALVAEELGRGLADVAFVGPTLAAELRRLAGAPSAEDVETVALSPDLASVARVLADEVPAAVAPDAGGADRALALVPSGSGWSLTVMGLNESPARVDLTRTSAVPDPATPLTSLEGTDLLDQDALDGWSALGLALTCADLVGVMRGAIDLTREYAANRRQFDAPIGSFQAVQHLLADAFVAMEGSRSVALHAAWAVDALGSKEALAAGAVAKAYCSRAARQVCEAAIQVHGGIGNTWDCLAHVYLRRALVSIDCFGGVGDNVERVLAHAGIGASHGLR